MLSLSKVNKKSVPIAYIKGGEYNDSLIFMTPRDIDKTAKERVKEEKFFDNKKPVPLNKSVGKTVINDKQIYLWDGAIVQIPKIMPKEKGSKLSGKMIFRHYLAGPSQCGKSYYIANLVKEYIDYTSKPRVFLFSNTKDDSNLDKFKEVQRFELDNEFVADPMTPEELENSLVIFDDVDSIPDKKLKKVILTLRDSILTKGRHNGISCICSNHQLADGHETKTMLRESQFITLFPQFSPKSKIIYLLKSYSNMDDSEIAEALDKIETRYITVFKEVPRAVMHSDGVYLL